MAIPTVQIVGKVYLADGQPAGSGTVACKLSFPGSVLDGATAQRVAAETTANIEADGSVSLALVPNNVIVPGGSSYEVRFRSVERSGRVVQWTERWQLASTPNPIDLGAVPRLDVVPGVAVGLATSLALYTSATRPPADASMERRLVAVKDAGSPMELQWCRQAADGSYEWITVAF